VIDRVFAIMALARAHTFIVLTKRSGRMRAYMAALPVRAEEIARQAACLWAGEDGYEAYYPVEEAIRCIPSNVWLGVSAERQREADERIPDLLTTPAAIRFVSAEPLLGHLNIEWSLSRNPLEIAAGFLKRGQFSPALETLRPLDQVIVGGESGRNARPMNPNWARSIRDQCTAAGTAFFFKQWGQWAPEDTFKDAAETYKSDLVAKRTWRFTGEPMRRRPKHIAGRLLDGVEHNGFPEARL
jgi:protein gp37